MIKYIILFLLSTPCFGWNSPEFFNSSFITLEEEINNETIRKSFKSAKGVMSSSIVENILKDSQERIDDTFIIPKYFKDSVYFWFSIYTQFTSKQVLIHDMKNLNLIYKVIDFSEIFSSNINRFAKANLKSRLTLEYTRKLKKNIRKLARANFRKLSADQKELLDTIKKSNTKIPRTRKYRKRFFLKLAKNIRTQSGQRNMIYQGVVRSLNYLPFLEKHVALFKLPPEILAIPFLESSFNPKAVSKVDASGIWQFMKYTNALFMPRVSKKLDYRRNPFISTIAAFHLLKENRLILRRWDLAVTGYNSGTRNLVKARKKYRKRKVIDLPFILENYKHKSLGFASKNFYSEFLALVHTRAYKDTIFPIEGIDKHHLGAKREIHIYVSKCKLYPKKVFKILKKSSPKISEMNEHLLIPKRSYPRGTLFVSDVDLTAKKFYKLKDKELKKKFPKKYHHYIKKKRCGKS